MLREQENGPHASKEIIQTGLSEAGIKTECLQFPLAPGFGAIDLETGLIRVECGHNGTRRLFLGQDLILPEADPLKLLDNLKAQVKKDNVRLVSVAIAGANGNFPQIRAGLWFNHDILAFEAKKPSEEAIEEIRSNFDEHVALKLKTSPKHEVIVPPLGTLEDYRRTTSPEDWKKFVENCREFKRLGIKMVRVSTSTQGGGVAKMNAEEIRVAELAGLDIKWLAMEGTVREFRVTKGYHNTIQAMETDFQASDESDAIYQEFTNRNFDNLRGSLEESNVFFIDDYQPSGLIPRIREEIDPDALIVLRAHTEIKSELAMTQGTPQYEVWSRIWKNIQTSDCFVFHPIEGFVPLNVPKEKVVLGPAGTDILDGLNKPLSEEDMDYYMDLFNFMLVSNGQTPLDATRPYAIQIARFDPAKGIDHVIDSYAMLRKKLKAEGKEIPQLVICGNGAPDDPDGAPIYEKTLAMINSDPYKEFANDVKVARLPHIDQMLNTLYRRSFLILQLSLAEGFEITVTEGEAKGKAVIVYKAGGIPLQVKHDINGYVIEIGRIDLVAEVMHELFTNKEKYEEMCVAAKEHYRKDVLAIPLLNRDMQIAIELKENGKIQDNGREI